VEPSNLPNILLQNLKEGRSKNILVYGAYGYGKTTLVKYVLYKNAKELSIIFHGGIFHMKYGHKDNEVLSCQKELIRALQLNPQELQGLECWQIGSVRAKLEVLLNGLSGPVLLFIDDVWTGEMIDNSPELVTTKRSKLLVTSRFNLKPNQPNWIRIEMNETTNENAAAQLLASKAANNPNETKFPLGCEHIAQKILFKCGGCLFAITIIGVILWENEAKTPEKWEDVYEQFQYYADKAPAAEDYKGESKTIFAAIKLSLEYGQEESDRVGMENILRTLTLFENVGMETLGCPAIVVHLAWSYLQPEGGISHFKTLLNCLIARNLVENGPMFFRDSSMLLCKSCEFDCLSLPSLVKEYVSTKLDAIDMCNVLEMKSQGLFMGRKNILLATFLPICKTRHTNLELALSLGQYYYENWYFEKLFLLLGTKAENAILLASNPHKWTQGDVDALLNLLNFDKIRAEPAACILAQLADHFYGDDILQHRSIQGFIQNLKTLNEDSSFKGSCHIALKLVKYRTFAEQFAIDEDFMEILTNIIMQSRFGRDETFNLLLKLSQHKNIFYQTYTKISMKNILKQISSRLIQTIKSSGLDNVYLMLDFSLQYEDLAMEIIDKGGDDIVLGIFHHLVTLPNFKSKSNAISLVSSVDEPLLFLILERLANRKEGEAIIIRHAHLLLQLFLCNDETNHLHDSLMSKNISTLVRHKGIAQALITQEGVELLVGALEQGKIVVVPLVLQCLFFENEEFAYKVIAQGGWRMMTKGLQLIARGERKVMTKGLHSIARAEVRVTMMISGVQSSARGKGRMMTKGLQSIAPGERRMMRKGQQSIAQGGQTGRLMSQGLQLVPPDDMPQFSLVHIAQGGQTVRLMSQGLQLMPPDDMPQFSLMHIAKEMASQGEIQDLVREIITGNNSEYCLKLLEHLVTYHMDIMREELIAKGGIRCLLTCLTSLNQRKNYEIITSGLLQKVACDIKGAEEMMAHNGIQVLMQLLNVGLNDDTVNYVYIENIVNIIELLVNGSEDPMKLLMSLIDDVDVSEIHKTLLRRYRSLNLSFLPGTLDVDIKFAKEWLNSLGPPFNAFNISSYLHKDDYEDDYKNDYNVVIALTQLSKHTGIASMIMANAGILERFLIQLSKGNLDNYAFEFLKVVLQHESVATQVVHQRPSFIKELLQLLSMEIPSIFTYGRTCSVASLLLILAKHGGVFIDSIAKNEGIEILLQKALLQNWIGRCDVIEVLGIMAKDEVHALQIEKSEGSKMLLRVISCYLQYVHDTHLQTVNPYSQIITEYEDDLLVMCCLKTLSFLLIHEEIATQILITKEGSKECGITALVDVMQIASQLWSSITLTLRESVVSKKLMQIKGHMLTILSNVASTLVLMAKLHPHINISKKVYENVFEAIFQLQGMVIDEHQALKKAIQDLLDIKKFHIKTWSCQQ
jgi:hypothetical protein